MSKISIALIVIAAIFVVGCGSSHHYVNTSNLNTQQKKEFQEAETIVRHCIKRISPHLIIACIAPPGHVPALTKCVASTLSESHTKKKLEEGLTLCVVHNR